MRSILKSILMLTLLTGHGPAFALQSASDAADNSGAGIVSEAAPELAANQRGCTSLSQAVEQVRRQGRIVSAETRMQGNQEVHVIKVLTADGKVKTVRIQGCRRN